MNYKITRYDMEYIIEGLKKIMIKDIEDTINKSNEREIITVINELSKKKYFVKIKELLLNESTSSGNFNYLIRSLINSNTKVEKLVHQLLYCYENDPEKIFYICLLIDNFNLKKNARFLDYLLDKYYYSDFSKSTDKINYKNNLHLKLVRYLIFLLGKFNYRPPYVRQTKVSVYYKNINNNKIGAVVYDQTNKESRWIVKGKYATTVKYE